MYVMNTRFYGVTSLALVGIATVIAASVLFGVSWLLGGIYLILSATGAGGIIYAYCAKCPCKAHCAHVIPGKLARNINRQPGPYTTLEQVVVVTALVAILGLPQPWLWRSLWLFIAYWVLALVAFVEILSFVCRTCGNVHCPVKMMRTAGNRK